MNDARYERLVRHHRDAVYRQMVRTCGNYDDAEDVLVEALMKAYGALGKLEDEGAFRSWLIRIGQRVCFRLRRKQALLPILSLSGLGPSDLDVADSADVESEVVEMEQMRTCIADALDALPPNLRAVYEQRELDGAPTAAVAKQFGITIGAVKTRLHRARAIVRDALDHGMCGSDFP